MTSDQIQLIGIQVNDRNTQESNRLQSERNQADKWYQQQNLYLTERAQNWKEDYDKQYLEIQRDITRLTDERDRLKIEYEHADRARQLEINARLSDIQSDLAAVEQNKADADAAYKLQMADIAEQSRIDSRVYNDSMIAINSQNANTNEFKAKQDAWLRQEEINTQREYNANYYGIQKQLNAIKLKEAQDIDRYRTYESQHRANELLHTQWYHGEQLKRLDRQINLDESKYGTSKTQYVVDKITEPVNTFIHGFARGLASGLGRSNGGYTHVKTEQEEAREGFFRLFKDNSGNKF